MNLAEILQEQCTLCEQIHRLLLEENHLLQTTRKPPGEDFLARKRDLLPRLDGSRFALGRGKRMYSGEISLHLALIERLQRKMLSLLLLDRENEKLLLKYSIQTDAFRIAAKPHAHLVSRAYSAAA